MNQYVKPAQVSDDLKRAPDPTSVSMTEEISLLDVIIVVAGKRRLIAKIVLCAALIGTITSLLLPPHYTASTSILPPQQSSAGSALLSQLGSLGSVASLASGSLGLKNPNDLQVAMLKSRTVEDAMIDRFHLMQRYKKKYRSDTRKNLEKKVDIDSGSKDGLIRIAVTDNDPRYAAEMANGYVEEFKEFSASLAITEASQRRLFFERQLSQAKDNLANAEQELKITEQRTGLIQLDSQARASIELVAGLRAQIAAKEVQISGLRSFATGENPDLQMAEQELAGLRSQEQKMGAPSEGASNEIVPKGNLQQAGIEYVQKVRNVKYFETIFELLARQYEIAKVDEARQGALVQVVDRAVVPDRRSWPMRTLIVLGSAIFGLLLGIVWVISVREFARVSASPAGNERLQTLRRLFSAKRSNSDS